MHGGDGSGSVLLPASMNMKDQLELARLLKLALDSADKISPDAVKIDEIVEAFEIAGYTLCAGQRGIAGTFLYAMKRAQ